MINLEEAIKQCEEVAENQEWMAENYDDDSMGKKQCKECAEEHRQLADWLMELKFYRTMIPSASEYFRTGEVNADEPSKTM